MLYALKIAARYLTASKAQTALLVVGVALQRGGPVHALGSDATQGLDEIAPNAAAVGAKRKAPGVSAAGPLAHLTSHSR